MREFYNHEIIEGRGLEASPSLPPPSSPPGPSEPGGQWGHCPSRIVADSLTQFQPGENHITTCLHRIFRLSDVPDHVIMMALVEPKQAGPGGLNLSGEW